MTLNACTGSIRRIQRRSDLECWKGFSFKSHRKAQVLRAEKRIFVDTRFYNSTAHVGGHEFGSLRRCLDAPAGGSQEFFVSQSWWRTRVMDLLGSFVTLKRGIRDHKGMRSQILIQDAHQPQHPAEAWQRRVPQKGPPWLHSDSRCWLLCLQIEIS